MARSSRAILCLILCGVVWASAAPGATTSAPDPKDPRYVRDLPGLKRQLKAARAKLMPRLKALESQREALIRQWIELAEIPAPSKKEHKRGAYVARQLRAAGLKVRVDGLGNVIGLKPGSEGKKHKKVALLAHMDTVFPASLSHKVRRRGHKLFGLGVIDDSAGVFSLIAVARWLKAQKIQFKRDVWFVATVQEEIGLVGAAHFIKAQQKRLAMVVSIDGGYGGLAYGAFGIEWYQVLFRGKGNHTLSSMGKPSTTHAVAQAIAAIYKLRVPRRPLAKKTWYNVGKLGAGAVINAQAPEAWFTLDLRSMSAHQLERLKKAAFGIVQTTAYRVGVKAEIKQIQKLPAGLIPHSKKLFLVQATKAVLESLGVAKVDLYPGGANDHCPAVALGIPGINVGVVKGAGIHTRREWADTRPLVKGLQQLVLLLALTAKLH